MRRMLAAAAGLVALAGCGGPEAQQALRDTSRNLGKIRSGDLMMKMVLRPADGADVGFRLQGPFAIRRGARLPVARIAYTRLAGKRQLPATLISTGRSAFVRVDDTTYRLPPGQADALRIVSRGARGLEGLQLDIGRWIREPDASNGPDVGGDETHRLTGELRIGPACTTSSTRRARPEPGRSPARGTPGSSRARSPTRTSSCSPARRTGCFAGCAWRQISTSRAAARAPARRNAPAPRVRARRRAPQPTRSRTRTVGLAAAAVERRRPRPR